MFENIVNLITDPVSIVIIIAALGMMREVGKLFIKIGNTGKYAADKNDAFDSIGAFLMKAANLIGRAIAFFGVGDSPPKKP